MCECVVCGAGGGVCGVCGVGVCVRRVCAMIYIYISLEHYLKPRHWSTYTEISSAQTDADGDLIS